ncbi:predicted protein [Chaetoceros tenuissimus]|nr:predicted protein [Chaetoceros tenuissimus]GFH55308.1 predicted protein [Chaetoceros tenuissimus]GFH55335.1 predicted protein [Chaetoceros tenuissimus]GFH55938.1 predicted protein [Chaetoceros tenuissimus]GFH57708.1 predicted protein [Chaetoceros tenuissimus]
MEASVLKSEIRASESTLLDLKGRKIEAMKELRKMQRDEHIPAEEIEEQKVWTDQIEAQILAQADALIELEEQLDTLRAQEHESEE